MKNVMGKYILPVFLGKQELDWSVAQLVEFLPSVVDSLKEIDSQGE